MTEILSFFPEKEYYPFQKEAILNVYDAFNRGAEIVFLEAPWGVGKTIIGKTFANFFNKTFYLTGSKGLQSQILTKYPDVKTVSGRNNHPCLLEPKKSCAKAKCSVGKKEKCLHKPRRENSTLIYDFDNLCEYWKQKVEAIESKISIHNYDYFITETNHVGDFCFPRNYESNNLQDLSLGILDEAHNVGIKILHHYIININRVFLASIGIRFPTFTTNDEWVDWIYELKTSEIPAMLVSLKLQYENPKIPEFQRNQIPDKIEKIEDFAEKVNLLLNSYAKNKHIWMFIPKTDTNNIMLNLKIIPIIVAPFVEEMLFNSFDRKLLMSSTILNPYILIDDLGLKGRRMNFIKVPCPFPILHRLIYPLNIAKLDYDNVADSMPLITKTVEIILDLFPDKKGNIHSNSFSMNNYVLDTLSKSHSDRVISHRGGSNLKKYQDAIDEHKESDYPSVLMSPSIIEGIDLPGKQSEFQIIFKVPYDNEADNPQLKERRKIDPVYYRWLAATKLIQATGRPIRSTTDVAPTFFFDSRLGYFLKQNRNLIPQWWYQAIVPTPHEYSYISEQVKKLVNKTYENVINFSGRCV